MHRLVCSLAFCFVIFGCGSSPRVLIDTPAGPINGILDQGVHKFLGIPYAETTAGANRWRPPVPLAPWQDALDASKFGPWCPQFDFERRDEGQTYAGEGWTVFRHVPANSASDEDCLSLNVFAPPMDGVPKPVMVFLHGNALGSSYPLFDGTEIAKSGVVFVSINFRLHSMGIFAHPSLTKESAGSDSPTRFSELDRLAALRWVQDNIASFGGDPSRVTLAGLSEGGAAIIQLLASGQGQGLFHQAIVQSGNGWWNPMDRAQHEQFGCYIATLSGLDGCAATAAELRALPWSAIPTTGPYTIDGQRVAKGATQAIAAGQAMDIPLLIGWNDFDGSSLRFTPQRVIDGTHPKVLSTYDSSADTERLGYAIYTDRHSGAPARWVAHMLEEGAPSYLYLFSYVVSWERGDVPGAEHGYELPHIFASFDNQLDDMFPFLSNFLLTDEDRKMTNIMHACWMSFVKDGKPSCPSAPAWPQYTRDNDQLMELNLEPKVVRGYRATQLDAQEQHLTHYLQQVSLSIKKLLDQGIEAD